MSPTRPFSAWVGSSLEKLGLRRASIWVLVVSLAMFVATRRFHPIQGLGNPDIAGILYSADMLNRGLLPYHDTVDLKPPGSFFVVAAVFRFAARDISVLQLFYAIWLLAGAPALAIAGRALYGRDERGRLASSIAVSLYVVTIGVFDMNYASWMTPAYAWSFAIMIVGLRGGSKLAHLGAGVLAAMAYLLKSQSVVLAPLFLLLWFWGRRKGEPGAKISTLPLWIAGALLGAAPMFALYAAHGAALDLFHGIFPVETAIRYSARRNFTFAQLGGLWVVPRQQILCFGLQVTLAVATFLGARKRPESELAPLAPQWLFYLASVAGCALGGFRFYIHYLPQCLPALALLGAHPAALDWLARIDAPWKSVTGVLTRVHLAILVGLVAYGVARIPFGHAAAVDNRGYSHVELTGAIIRENTTADDRIVVWGWQAWGVYYTANRRSPSSLFKMLGEVTDLNDNSVFGNASPIHFRDGPLAERFLADVRKTPPAFIVRTNPFFPGDPTEPLDEFVAFKKILDADYDAIATYGQITIYQRKRPASKK